MKSDSNKLNGSFASSINFFSVASKNGLNVFPPNRKPSPAIGNIIFTVFILLPYIYLKISKNTQ